ncbi:MAG: glycosyltransferase family 1 protein [Candidatus Andersenbacteria bacterium]
MRIAVDVRSLMEGRHSGVEEYTTKILRHMAKVAPQHIFQAYYNSRRSVALPRFPKNVHPIAYRYPNKLFNSAQFVLRRPRWDRLVPADIFFVPNVRLTPLSSGIPMVSVAHDLSYELFPEFLNVRRRIWHRMMRPRQLMQNADHVIAVSEHTKEDVKRLYGLPEENISVVYSGLSFADEAARPAVIQEVRRKYNLPEQFVLYLGRFEPRKNITGIIEAFSAVAHQIDHDLVVAGESGWKQEEHIEARRQSPHRERIHITGFVAEEDKAALYAAADLFVYPSFYEGFGFPPLEAIAMGTPAVTSFNSALPEIVGPWATLVDPYNTPQLAAVIRELLRDPVRIPHTVRNTVRAIYNWDTAARQTVKTLERAVRK